MLSSLITGNGFLQDHARFIQISASFIIVPDT